MSKVTKPFKKLGKKIEKGIKTGASSLGGYVKSGLKEAGSFTEDYIKYVSGYQPTKDALEGIQDWWNKPYEEMEKAQRRAMQQQAELDAQAQLMQSNLSRDLRGENIAEVIAGGSSGLSGMSGSSRRRRRGGTGLTSSLQV